MRGRRLDWLLRIRSFLVLVTLGFSIQHITWCWIGESLSLKIPKNTQSKIIFFSLSLASKYGTLRYTSSRPSHFKIHSRQKDFPCSTYSRSYSRSCCGFRNRDIHQSDANSRLTHRKCSRFPIPHPRTSPSDSHPCNFACIWYARNLVLCGMNLNNNASLAQSQYYIRGKDSVGVRFGNHILLIISFLLIIREVFSVATVNNAAKQDNERFWYPLISLPEILVVMLYITPGLVPRRDELRQQQTTSEDKKMAEA